MATAVDTSLTGEEIVALCRKHTIFEWSVQPKVDPIPVARAKGVYFWTPEGKRYLDFNSQLMCTNIGHGHPKVVKAIQAQAEVLCYANPFMATEPRALLGKKLTEITPGDIDTFFFTNGGAEAVENAISIARVVTGRHKILVRYRSYHGGTAGALTLTGDPRRWASEPGISGVVRIPDFHKWGRKDPEPVDASLRYVELGAVGMRPGIARVFQEKAFPGGLTYNSHTLACAAALATIAVYEEEGLIENARKMGKVLNERMRAIAARHPSVGTHRNIGLFGIVELVRDRKAYEPMAPYNGASEEMAALGKFFREQGLYTLVRWNGFFTNPPLCITEAELQQGLDVIDKGLEITDRAVKG